MSDGVGISERVTAILSQPLDTVDRIAGLYESTDLDALGAAALSRKRDRFGDGVTYVAGAHINTTNVCRGTCGFCRFRRGPDDADAFFRTSDDLVALADRAIDAGACEVHITGGLDDRIDLTWWTATIGGIRRRHADVFIKACTAVEVDDLCLLSGLSAGDVLSALRDSGLDSLAGGGAEIFSARVRRVLCPAKISGDRWLSIHRAAHGLGLRSNATMLIGRVERFGERAEHLLALRGLQAETGGFSAFLLLPTAGASDADGGVGGVDLLKTLAIARLVLHNVAHIKVFRPIWGDGPAQLALSYGADDVDGSACGYRVVTGVAGRSGPSAETLIRSAGFQPVRRDGRYDAIAN